jgi:hypothetical protein
LGLSFRPERQACLNFYLSLDADFVTLRLRVVI